MTPEERSLLESTYKLSEENNNILKSMRRSGRISLILRISYWVLILIVSFGAYYFIQPYLNVLSGIYGTNMSSAQTAADSLKDLLK